MTHRWRLLAVFGIALAATACGSEAPVSRETLTDYDYRLKHPIEVQTRVAVLHLSALPGGALTADDSGRLKALAAAYVRRANGPLQISVGAANPQDPAARNWAQAIAQQLLAAGLRPAEMRLELILDEPAIGPGSALLRYATTGAELPECYDWSAGPRNAPSANFGCSLQRNLGQMVANPRDLEEPVAQDGTPAAHSGTAIDKMNRGAATWSVPLPLQATPNTSAGGS